MPADERLARYLAHKRVYPESLWAGSDGATRRQAALELITESASDEHIADAVFRAGPPCAHAHLRSESKIDPSLPGSVREWSIASNHSVNDWHRLRANASAAAFRNRGTDPPELGRARPVLRELARLGLCKAPSLVEEGDWRTGLAAQQAPRERAATVLAYVVSAFDLERPKRLRTWIEMHAGPSIRLWQESTLQESCDLSTLETIRGIYAWYAYQRAPGNECPILTESPSIKES